eukprot:794707-Pyramimonas_sp.AAC.1
MVLQHPFSEQKYNKPALAFLRCSAARASARGLAPPQRRTNQRQAPIAIAAAWVSQNELRVGGRDDCASNGVDHFAFGRVACAT